jgi:hypothetical protein
LTKWVSKRKLQLSIDYVSGTRSPIATGLDEAHAAVARLPLRVLILFAGRRRPGDVASVLRSRGHHVTTYEYLDDPVEQHLGRPSVQQRVLGEVEDGAYDFVILEPPCSSLSVAIDPPIRSPAEPYGIASMRADWGAYLAKHNALVAFSAAVVTAAHRAGVKWLVENPASRSHGPAAWPLKADRVSLWDMPEFVALQNAIPTALTTLVQCAYGSPFQKYTSMMAPRADADHLEAFLSAPYCGCSAHAGHAVGHRSAEAAEYPLRLCAAMADYVEAAAV